MLGWLQALMPKEGKFFDLFERHAQIGFDCAKTLRAVLDGGDQVSRLCDEVIRYEQEADAISAAVLIALRRSFITPFDRGDIHGLINDMDDAVDQMRQTVKNIFLFDVVTFDADMKRVGDLIVEAARISRETMPLLRAMNANAGKINEAVVKIIALEEESDHLYMHGLKELYRAHKDSRPMDLYGIGSVKGRSS